ncbi:twin-arginine translocation signal domain-containing protein [Streptomyces sp. NPDC019443]|uniref:twin-arginine translocation signal domain-containing protein n=1 Tax=Streptomyces sp. NPDC019443 TaxID=3365061 RepID=UPI003789647C
MPLNRRHFLQTAALTLGAVALTATPPSTPPRCRSERLSCLPLSSDRRPAASRLAAGRPGSSIPLDNVAKRDG